MTKSQTARYWRDWGRVRKVLIELGEFSKTDADEQRKVIQREAIGCDKSSKDLTNADLDKVFKAFAAVLVMVDGPAAPEEVSGPCKRLIWAIDKFGIDPDYLARMAMQQFKTADWRSLPEHQLRLFRFTAAAYASSLKK